jgi:hypothetical protein
MTAADGGFEIRHCSRKSFRHKAFLSAFSACHDDFATLIRHVGRP